MHSDKLNVIHNLNYLLKLSNLIKKKKQICELILQPIREILCWVKSWASNGQSQMVRVKWSTSNGQRQIVRIKSTASSCQIESVKASVWIVNVKLPASYRSNPIDSVKFSNGIKLASNLLWLLSLHPKKANN